MKRMNALIILIVLIVILAAGIGFLTARGKTVSPSADTNTSCTEEAKLCPDGSGVGRQGPNCEFPDCPTQSPAAKPE